MKCPNCGEEIDYIFVEGKELVWIREVFQEMSDGSFSYGYTEDTEPVDYQMDQIVCPKCGGRIDLELIRFK